MPANSRADAINTLSNMVFPLRQRFAGMVGVAVALLLALLGMPVHAAIVRGEFTGGLYTAPGELFTIESPLGSRPRLVDGFQGTVGSVTFIDDTGQLFGVVCTPDLDMLAGVKIDTEISQAILRNWFRDSAFPTYFAGTMPGSTILRTSPANSRASLPGLRSCTCRTVRRWPRWIRQPAR